MDRDRSALACAFALGAVHHGQLSRRTCGSRGAVFVSRPASPTIAVATLALGIGANSAIFTVVNAVVVRPLPYRERAIGWSAITADFTGLSATDVGLSQPELARLSRSQRSLRRHRRRLGDQREPHARSISPSASRRCSRARRTSTCSACGRSSDGCSVRRTTAPGITEVLVISDALWRRRFGASPSAIGRKLRIDNDWYTVVGVLPPGFRHPGPVGADRRRRVGAGQFRRRRRFPKPPVRGAYFLTGAIATAAARA